MIIEHVRKERKVVGKWWVRCTIYGKQGAAATLEEGYTDRSERDARFKHWKKKEGKTI